MRLQHVQGDAKCHDLLDVVDAAFARPSGPEGHYMADAICPGCPIWEECLEFAMAHGERGPWGGTTERQRRAVHHLNNTANTRARSWAVTPNRTRGAAMPEPELEGPYDSEEDLMEDTSEMVPVVDQQDDGGDVSPDLAEPEPEEDHS